MHIGVIFQATANSARVDQLAFEVEQRGLSALYVSGDHTHIPARRSTPYPGGRPLPDGHRRAFDPLIALAAAAARTERIRLGTGVFLAAQRDPISTAKQVATLDALAPGRIDLGIGYGWNVEEAADHGVVWATRREQVREYIAAMRTLWVDEEASFAGQFVTFERAWMWPKPPAGGLPRILLGASPGPRTFQSIAAWGDGWLPVPGWGHGPEHVRQLRAVAEEMGRDPDELVIVVPGEPVDPELLDRWYEVNADTVLTPVPSLPNDELLPMLDAAAAICERYAKPHSAAVEGSR
jgi:probable F420-dependent oxidoreductase